MKMTLFSQFRALTHGKTHEVRHSALYLRRISDNYNYNKDLLLFAFPKFTLKQERFEKANEKL